MKTTFVGTGALLLSFAGPVFAHEVDEYVQATTIAVEKDHVRVGMRLTPGTAVFGVVRAAIDADGDGTFSDAERRTYAARVLGDLSLAVDGEPLPLRLVSWRFADLEQMQEGRGDILLELLADVPPGGPNRRLTFVNHHQRAIAAYLVNALVPRDPDITVGAQSRSYEQSSYRLEYVQRAAATARPFIQASSGARGVFLVVALSVLGWIGLRPARNDARQLLRVRGTHITSHDGRLGRR